MFSFLFEKRAGKKRQERKNELTRKNIPDIKLVGGRREPRWRGALKSVKIFKRANARTKLVHGQRGCVPFHRGLIGCWIYCRCWTYILRKCTHVYYTYLYYTTTGLLRCSSGNTLAVVNSPPPYRVSTWLYLIIHLPQLSYVQYIIHASGR